MAENTEIKDWEKTLGDMHNALKASREFILSHEQSGVYTTDRGTFSVRMLEKKVSDALKDLHHLATTSEE